ncbi:hypothetical protein LCGC14_2464310 [marine sediment metagenome]|uniref:Uncharacterized protein n=1 Tax=marine sediment metagenome TaxID=412755 RepID=A0A0F9DPH1_9ZZZZ
MGPEEQVMRELQEEFGKGVRIVTGYVVYKGRVMTVAQKKKVIKRDKRRKSK